MLLAASFAQAVEPVPAAMPVSTDPVTFTQDVAARIRHASPRETVRIDRPLTLLAGPGPLRISLDRIFRFCQNYPSRCAVEVEHFSTMVAGRLAESGAVKNPARASIRLVVRTAEYVAALQARAKADGAVIPARPLVKGLMVVAVQDRPTSVEMASMGVALALGVTEDGLFALGVENLRAVLKPLSEVASPTKPGAFQTLNASLYDTSRLIPSADWAALARRQGGVLLVAVPATDFLIYSADDTPEGIAALKGFAAQTKNRAANPLSEIILRWTPAGWVVQ